MLGTKQRVQESGSGRPPEDQLVGLCSRRQRRLAVLLHQHRDLRFLQLHSWEVRGDGAYSTHTSRQIRIHIDLIDDLIRTLRQARAVLHLEGKL